MSLSLSLSSPLVILFYNRPRIKFAHVSNQTTHTKNSISLQRINYGLYNTTAFESNIQFNCNTSVTGHEHPKTWPPHPHPPCETITTFKLLPQVTNNTLTQGTTRRESMDEHLRAHVQMCPSGTSLSHVVCESPDSNVAPWWEKKRHHVISIMTNTRSMGWANSTILL